MSLDTNVLFPARIDNFIDMIYPVGCIYLSTVDTDPSILFGGSWARWGKGKVPVSLDEDDGNFNTVEKIGGALTHAHTSAAHTHSINGHTHTGPSHTHTIASHAHTSAAHTHSINGHTHTGPSHQHSTGDCTLSINQMPAHHHTINYYPQITGGQYQGVHGPNGGNKVGSDWRAINDEGGGQPHNHGATGWAGTGATGSTSLTTNSTTPGNTGGSGQLTTSAAGTGATGSTSLTTNSTTPGNTGSTSTLQPYITCYMWKRIE